jgi:hypothetical protein
MYKNGVPIEMISINEKLHDTTFRHYFTRII